MRTTPLTPTVVILERRISVGLYTFRKEDARRGLFGKSPSSHPTHLLKNCKELGVITEDMEIYVLYNFIATLLDYFSHASGATARIVALTVGGMIWLGLFLLQGFGLSTMAKGQGLKKRWMAFVPIANILYIGKLAGESKIFNQRVKRAGMYAMIAQIVSTLTCALLIFAELYLYIVEGEPYPILFNGYKPSLTWGTTSGFSFAMEKLHGGGYGYGFSILSIVQLIYELMMFIMLMSLYKKYSVKNHMALSFLSLFVPMSRYIVIFALRKNKAVDYEALMRKKREEYMRQQQQRYSQNPYGNPFGGPFGNPYGHPYGNPYAHQNQNVAKPDGEPFEEFSTGEKNAKNTNGENGDGFFN